jgi:hypothetical protein
MLWGIWGRADMCALPHPQRPLLDRPRKKRRCESIRKVTLVGCNARRIWRIARIF